MKSLVQNLFIFELNFYNINISDTITNVAVFTEILPVIFYLCFRKSIFIKRLGIILLLSVLYFIIDVHALYLMYYEHRNNFFFYNVLLLIETILLYYFFHQVLKSLFLKKLLIFLGCIFIVFWTFSFFKFGSKSYFSACINFENLSIFVLALFFYYEQIIVINSLFIYAESIFWVVTAYFIYSASTLFLFLYIPSLDSPDQEKYYLLNYIFIIMRTLLLSISIFMKPGLSRIERNF